jgi:glycosyltransferase involved in cell wall biosynthesis
VSDGAPHKNHRRLLQAWAILAGDGIYPTLALTLHPSRDKVLREEVVATSDRHSLRIRDLGQLPHQDLLRLYHRASALLFPSLAESFGIPLIEATEAGLPIIAPELDYVRDVCIPIETFDAHSPRSIARAVKRFLRMKTDCLDILSADALVQSVIGQTENNGRSTLTD